MHDHLTQSQVCLNAEKLLIPVDTPEVITLLNFTMQGGWCMDGLLPENILEQQGTAMAVHEPQAACDDHSMKHRPIMIPWPSAVH